jgi:hypothetical protein
MVLDEVCCVCMAQWCWVYLSVYCVFVDVVHIAYGQASIPSHALSPVNT